MSPCQRIATVWCPQDMYQSRHFWPSHSPCQVLVQHARCRHSICTFDRWNQQNPSCTSLLLSWCSCQLPEASNCHLSTCYLSLSAPWLLLHWLAVWLSHSNQLNLKNEYSFRIENGQWSVLWTTMEKIKVQISYLHTHHINNNVKSYFPAYGTVKWRDTDFPKTLSLVLKTM